MKFRFNWKTVVGSLFVLSGLYSFKEGIGTVIGEIVIGGALILWGMEKNRPQKHGADQTQTEPQSELQPEPQPEPQQEPQPELRPQPIQDSTPLMPMLKCEIVVSDSKGKIDEAPCYGQEKMYSVEKPRSKKRLQALQKGGYVVFDVETTGLSPQCDRIIDLALLRVDENGVQSCFSSLFNPGCHINSKIRKLTGICDEDVADASRIEDKVQEIIDFIGDLPLVAHNASFDGNFLSAAFTRSDIRHEFTMIDTLWMARNAFPGLPNYKLATLIETFQLSDGPQEHRAMGDAECTQKLFEQCVNELLRQKEAELAARRAAKA